MRWTCGCVLLCLLSASAVAQKTCAELQQLLDGRAHASLVKQADKGSLSAQLTLGRIHECTQEFQEAARWYRLAADRGDPAAQTNLGSLLAEGHLPKDETEAFKLYLRAASSGFAPAQNNVAIMYYNGRGTPISYESAAAWFTRAVAQKYWPAYAALAKQYLSGRGIAPDSDKAVRLLRESAEHGNISAMENLALLFAHGTGVPQDANQAIAWNLKAATTGSPSAANNLAYLYERSGDFVDAVQWYRRAADAGVAIAEYNLAVLYLTGRGVKRDSAESDRLMALAATHGYRPPHRDEMLVEAASLERK